MKMRGIFLIITLVFAIVSLSILYLESKNFNEKSSGFDSSKPDFVSKIINLVNKDDDFLQPSVEGTDEGGGTGGNIGPTATSLGLNEVFVMNDNSIAVNNQLVSIPVSFADGEATDSNIYQFILEDVSNNLRQTTQIQPTSYYPKTGNVRTAVAHTKVTLQPAQEKIYRVVRDQSYTPPTFQFSSSVNSFLQGGQIKVVSKDVNQVPYEVILPPLNQMNMVLGGPLVQVYEYHKAHRPISPADLTHLGSSVFYVTFVSNEPLVRIQHMWVNTHNLDELTRSRDSNGVWRYSEGQNGHLKYHDLNLFVNTGSVSASADFLDDAFLFPSSISQNANLITLAIMPANGQQLLGSSSQSQNYCRTPSGGSTQCQFNPVTYSCDPVGGYTGSCVMFERGGYSNSLNPPKNYISTGQGLMSEITVYFDSMRGRTTNYFVENGLASGQSIERYDLVDSLIYSELSNVANLGKSQGYQGRPTWDFNLDADDTLNGGNRYGLGTSGVLSAMNSEPYRFGHGGTGRRDMGASGDGETLHTMQTIYLKYLMSCSTRCEPRYIQALRYMALSVPSIPEHLIGFNVSNHDDASIGGYRTRPFPTSRVANGAEDGGFCGLVSFRLQTTGQSFTSKDYLGYCDQTVNLANHQLDYPVGTYGLSREWLIWDDAHFGPGRLADYYKTTGDFMQLHLYKDVVGIWGNSYHNMGFRGGIRGQARGTGRALVAISELYRVTKDPYYKQTLEFIPSIIERFSINQDPVGSRGTNPVTGDAFAVGFLDYKDDDRINRYSQSLVGVTWEDSIAMEGLYNIYHDITTNPSVRTSLENIFDRYLLYMFNYAYKDPRDVKNGISLNHQISNQPVAVNEGAGYFTEWVAIGPRPGISLQNYNEYTKFVSGGSFYLWMNYAICGIVRDYGDSRDPSLKDKAKKAFEAAFIYYLDGGDATQDWADRGLNLGKFEAYQICSLNYLLNIPPTVSTTCVDNDNDGFSTCTGDCNDNDPNINPMVIEKGSALCFDNIDNNCNTLKDCNDAQCSNPRFSSSSCNGIAYCGNLQLDSSRGEQCDISPYVANAGSNNCLDFTCTPPYVYAEGRNCLCLAQPTCGDNRINQASEQCDGSALGYCPVGRCTSQCLCDAPMLISTDPTSIPYDQQTLLTLNGNNFAGNMQFIIDNTPQPTVGVTYQSNQEVTAIITAAHTRTWGEGIHRIKLRDSRGVDSKELQIRVNRNPQIISFSPTNNAIVSNQNPVRLDLQIQDADLLNLDIELKRPSDSALSFVSRRSSLTSGAYNFIEIPRRVNLESNLKAFYDFEGNVNDKSGSNFNPVTVQGTSTPSIFGSGYRFNGANRELISLGDISSCCNSNANILSFDGVPTFTLEGWIKPDATQPGLSNNNVYLFGKKGDSLGYGLRLVLQGGSYFVQGVIGYPWRLGGQTLSLTSSNPLTLDNWHHVALVGSAPSATNGNLVLYVDGIEVGRRPWVESSAGANNNLITHTNSWSFTIGSPHRDTSKTEPGGSFSGIIDDVLVYDRALSATEIQTHASPTVASPPGQYQWRATVSDGLGQTSTGLIMFTMSSTGGISLPNTPSNLFANTLSSTSIQLTWQDNSNNENNFILSRRSIIGGNPNPWFNRSISANSVTYTDSGLTPGTYYEYRILANNSAGQSSWSISSFNTTLSSGSPSPSISSMSPSTIQWSDNNILVTILGTNFATDSKVFVDGVELPSNRLTRVGSTEIRFNYQREEFRVGSLGVYVRNPSTSLNSNTVNLVMTSNPSINSLVPSLIVNNLLNLVNITGNDFDPLARVFLGTTDVSNSVNKINSSLFVLSLPATPPVGDYGVTVRSGDGQVTSNSRNLRINAPFNYIFEINASIIFMESNDSVISLLNITSNNFMTQETVTVSTQKPADLNITFIGLNNCVPNTSLTPPTCQMLVNISSNLSVGQYNISFNAISSLTSVRKQINVTFNIINLSLGFCGDNICNASIGETCSTCSADCGGCGSSGGGSSGGGGGGGGSGGRGGPRILQQCEDGLDNDNDGKLDYPADPGCFGLGDSTELDASELVKSNYSLNMTDGSKLDELNSRNRDVNIRVVFWLVLGMIVLGILVVTVLIIRSMSQHSKYKALFNG